MRRDIELIREILLAIGDDNISDSRELVTKLSRKWEILDYHLNLLVYGTCLLSGKFSDGTHIASSMGGGKDEPPHWHSLSLTWDGNDFLDTFGDEKAWGKVRKAMKAGTKLAITEGIKQAVKGFAAAGFTIILKAGEEAKGQTSYRTDGSSGLNLTAKSEDS